jgi:hypothetical protein
MASTVRQSPCDALASDQHTCGNQHNTPQRGDTSPQCKGRAGGHGSTTMVREPTDSITRSLGAGHTAHTLTGRQQSPAMLVFLAVYRHVRRRHNVKHNVCGTFVQMCGIKRPLTQGRHGVASCCCFPSTAPGRAAMVCLRPISTFRGEMFWGCPVRPALCQLFVALQRAV